MPALDPALVAVLACPQTHQPLHPATAAEVARLPATAPAWLVRADGAVAYPIVDGIPHLLPDAAEPLPAPRS